MTSFFRSCDESEKCLKQITHIVYNCFLYSDAWRYIIAIIMKRLISGLSRHSRWYKITTTDWLALDNNMFRISKITHVWFITINVYYGLFGKLIKGSSHLENFETPVIDSLFSTKVVKTLTSSSPANGSRGRSFKFVKCPPCLKAI